MIEAFDYQTFKNEYKAMVEGFISKENLSFKECEEKMSAFHMEKVGTITEAAYKDALPRLHSAPDKHEFLLRMICENMAVDISTQYIERAQADIEDEMKK